jgi:hypothetical protein
MRRIAISTPNVMRALRPLNRDQARPYNLALSPVIVNLSEFSGYAAWWVREEPRAVGRDAIH